ncbi:MAG: MBL fold metallo-hydrolase [Jiangellaceae bacterium]
MRLTVVGCSGSLPGPESAASCYLVEVGDSRIVLDLGSGAIGSLQRYVELADVDAILLSHLHPDHCLDLCGYYVALRYGPDRSGGLIPVWGPPRTAARMARAYDLPVDPGMTREFDFRTYPDGSFDVGTIRVTARRVVHPVPAYGLRIEHGGRVLAYSGDTGPTPALAELAAGADVLLCEASFLGTDENPPHLHLTGTEAGEHAAAAGVGSLVLTHVPPWGEAERAQAEAAAVFADSVTLARPGLVIDI